MLNSNSGIRDAAPTVLGRLAPSPTGAQHLGNARTYLLAWLAARSVGGELLLRIEDIDSPRVKPWATAQAIEDLRWLGLDWDAGPDLGGPHAPYIQTERVALYDAAWQRLVAKGLAYPCTCSRKDIAVAASAPHETSVGALHGEGVIYPGTCAAWTTGDPLPPAGTYCWRFRATDQTLGFVDRLQGEKKVNSARVLGDFPLTRKSGEAAYQLAVVVDDAEMKVNQVVRGDDLIPSTFRQLELFAALAHAPPEFLHVPLVYGSDGRRLAKRHGDTRLNTFRKQGVLPQQIIGWAAASIGLIDRPIDIQPRDLVAEFSFAKLSRSQTVVSDDPFPSRS